MSKYVVFPLYLTGKGKKIFKSGDIVTELDFENSAELIAKGRLRPVETEKKSNPILEPVKDKKPLFVVERDGESIDVFDESDIHKKDIVELLEKIEGLEFDSTDKKAILWDLLISRQKSEQQ